MIHRTVMHRRNISAVNVSARGMMYRCDRSSLDISRCYTVRQCIGAMYLRWIYDVS